MGFDGEGEAGGHQHGVEECEGEVEALEVGVSLKKDRGGGRFRRGEGYFVGAVEAQVGVKASLGSNRQRNSGAEIKR